MEPQAIMEPQKAGRCGGMLLSWNKDLISFKLVLGINQGQEYSEGSPYLVRVGSQQIWQFKGLQWSPVTEGAQFSYMQGFVPKLDNYSQLFSFGK
jgi:hypothetical protein